MDKEYDRVIADLKSLTRLELFLCGGLMLLLAGLIFVGDMWNSFWENIKRMVRRR